MLRLRAVWAEVRILRNWRWFHLFIPFVIGFMLGNRGVHLNGERAPLIAHPYPMIDTMDIGKVSMRRVPTQDILTHNSSFISKIEQERGTTMPTRVQQEFL